MMKYGILFTIIGTLIAIWGGMHGGWYQLSIWPAVSFGVVAIGYCGVGPSVFGKHSDGTQSISHFVPLLPYLAYMHAIWYLARLIKTEPAYDQLTDNIIIGRRLLSRECPSNIDMVVDLTCEFAEAKALRAKRYFSFQILDASIPSPQQLISWAKQIKAVSGTVYIHCAEGHGRTGLFAATLLLVNGHSDSAVAALKLIQSKRPLVRLGREQQQALQAVAQCLAITIPATETKSKTGR